MWLEKVLASGWVADMITPMSNKTETAVQMLTEKYGKEKWFVKAESYGIETVAVFYRDTKHVPDLWGKLPKFHTYTGCRVRWLEVP